MTSSYLGIVSQRGLETLQLETDHLASFLMRRAYRRQRARCLCCWAVLGDREADVITRLIRTGDFDKALLLLNILSIHLGTLTLTKHGIARHLARDATEIARQQGAFTIFSLVDALTRLTQKVRFAGDRVEADARVARLLALAA